MDDEMEEEYIPQKWGQCAICRKCNYLLSVVGQNKGEFWAGWICHECYLKVTNKDVK